MLKLEEHRAKITSGKSRPEFHGQECVYFYDIKIKVAVGNAILDDFSPGLCESYYKKASQQDVDEMDLVDNAEHEEGALAVLRHPIVKQPFSLDYKTGGYRVIVHQGFSEKENIYLINCELVDFKFTCHNGGTVDVELRIIAKPNSEEMGKLDNLLQQEVDLTLEPTSAEKLAQMELDEARGQDEEEYDEEKVA